MNVDNETGEYKKSPEEIEAELKQTLLDAINRVPFESEAADRGTAFNAIIDCYIHRKKHIPNEREPYTIIGDEETNIIQVAFPSTDIAPARHFCLTEHGVLNSRGILLVHCLKSLSLPLFPPVTVMWALRVYKTNFSEIRSTTSRRPQSMISVNMSMVGSGMYILTA